MKDEYVILRRNGETEIVAKLDRNGIFLGFYGGPEWDSERTSDPSEFESFRKKYGKEGDNL